MDEQNYGENVTAADIAAIKKNHGKFTNRVFVQVDGMNLRIHLGELIGGDPLYHTAAVMNSLEALEFAELLTAMANQSISQFGYYYSEPTQGGQDGE